MKKSTKIIIAVVSVLVVAAIVFAVLYFATDLFKTKNPKKAFFESLEKYAIGDENFSYSEMLEKLKSEKDSAFEGNGKISMNIELGEDLMTEEIEALLKVLNQMEINYELKADPENLNANMTMDFKYDGNDVGTVELLMNEDKIGFKVKDVTDKYLTVDLKDMLDSTSSSGSLDLSSLEEISEADIDEIIDLLNVSDEQIKTITNIVKKALEDAIPEDNFSSEKEKITVNGKELNTTAYTVKISGNDAMNFLKNVLEGLKDDEDILNLIVDKTNKIFNTFIGTSTKVTKSQVKSLLNSTISELENTDVGDSVYKITLFVNKDQTVRLQFEQEDNAIIIDSIKEGDTTNAALKVKSDGSEMTILNIEETKKGDDQYSTKVSTDIEGVKVELTFDTVSSEKVNMKLYAEVLDQMKITLNMEVEAKEASVKIDKLTSNNSIDAQNIPSDEEEKIMSNLVDYLEENIQSIADDIGYGDEFEEYVNYLKNALSLQTSVDTTIPEEINEAA